MWPAHYVHSPATVLGNLGLFCILCLNWMNSMYAAQVRNNMLVAYTYMKTNKAHLTYLSWVKSKKLESKWKKQKTCWTIYTKEKKGRLNLKIGTHSSFLQMKARKWKSLESCLVWKSKVMNNASVSMIKSVLIRWISPAPAGWKAHTTALLTNQQWDKSPLAPWTSQPCCWSLTIL